MTSILGIKSAQQLRPAYLESTLSTLIRSDNGLRGAGADVTGLYHSHMPVCHTSLSDLLDSGLEAFFGTAPLRKTPT